MRAPINETPLTCGVTTGFDALGRRYFLLVAKATYTWDDHGRVHWAPEPDKVPVHDQDIVNASDARVTDHESDLVPHKPLLDVLLTGAIQLSRPTDQIDAALLLGRRLSKTMRLVGERRWYCNWLGLMKLDEPRPFNSLPIAWTHSFGGTDPQESGYVERRNPVGRGFCRDKVNLVGLPAACFEHPQKEQEPVGFGCVARHWLPRSGYAGTYDAAWQEERAPFLPLDFNPRFFNAAPADQQLAGGYLPGERLGLFNLTPRGREWIELPALSVPITFVQRTGAVTNVQAAPDTIIVNPAKRQLCLVARATLPLVPDIFALHEVRLGPLAEKGGARS